MDTDDLALQTLLSVREEMSPLLDGQILRQCYAIQKRHQFNADRTQSATAMEKLIDANITTVPTNA